MFAQQYSRIQKAGQTETFRGLLVRRSAGADALANAAQLWVVPAEVELRSGRSFLPAHNTHLEQYQLSAFVLASGASHPAAGVCE